MAAAAAFQQPLQPPPPQPIDATALQIWCSRVDGRLDDQATAITGVGLMTIGHAKDAMNAIIEGVRGELVGFKRQVHHDHGQLNIVVAATQQRFAEVEAWCTASRRTWRTRWRCLMRAQPAPSSALPS